MLLRSITKHVDEQNWFAVFLDFFIVVVGILIAFQITNWNEARLEEQSRQLMIQNLQGDYQSIVTRLDKDLVRAERLVNEAEEVYKMLSREEGVTSEELGILPGALYKYTIAPLPSPTFVELTSSGQLSRLKNRKLQEALLQYQREQTFYLEIMTEAREVFKPDTGLMRAIEFGSSDEYRFDLDASTYAVEPLRERIHEIKFHMYNLSEQEYILEKMLTKAKTVLAELEAAK